MTCNKKYVVQVVYAEDDSVVREIVCGNSERFAEQKENEEARGLDYNHYTRIIERTIDKQV